ACKKGKDGLDPSFGFILRIESLIDKQRVKWIAWPQLLPFFPKVSHGFFSSVRIDSDADQVAPILRDHKYDRNNRLMQGFKVEIPHHPGYKSPSVAIIKLLSDGGFRICPADRPYRCFIEDK